MEKELQENEEIIGTYSIHKMILLPSLFVLICSVMLFFIGMFSMFYLICLVSFLLFLNSFIILIRKLFLLNTTKVYITNQRVLYTSGWYNKKIFSILLSKIESESVIQSKIGKKFNYGTVMLSGTGGSPVIINDIISPYELRKNIRATKNNNF